MQISFAYSRPIVDADAIKIRIRMDNGRFLGKHRKFANNGAAIGFEFTTEVILRYLLFYFSHQNDAK